MRNLQELFPGFRSLNRGVRFLQVHSLYAKNYGRYNQPVPQVGVGAHIKARIMITDFQKQTNPTELDSTLCNTSNYKKKRIQSGF